MNFKQILRRALDAGGLDATLFMDDTGEVVEMVGRDGDAFDLKVAGAYLGICLRQTESLLQESELGEPRLLHIERERYHFHVRPLEEGYFLAAVQRGPALSARARRALERAASDLSSSLFAEEP